MATHLQEYLRDRLHRYVSYVCPIPSSRILPISSLQALIMPSLNSMWRAALASAQIALLTSSNLVSGGSPAFCPRPQLSCHNTTTVQNTCCFNAPGGQLLQTQFWDTNPATGPADHWTVHGLWYVWSPLQRGAPANSGVGQIIATAPTIRTAIQIVNTRTLPLSCKLQARPIFWHI